MTVTLSGTPTLETDRLILRAPRAGDAPVSMAFLMSDRARYVGGPLDARLAWRATCHLTGHWVHRGFGMFIFADRAAPDTPLGMAGPWFPEGWPETEIGWSVWVADAEGRGLAFEAAQAARAWAFAELGWTTAVSYIDHGNERSAALARRLGAVEDATAPQPFPDEPCRVFRHSAPGAHP
jgi:RimJ/RimL family protein N-acetyltransferase